MKVIKKRCIECGKKVGWIVLWINLGLIAVKTYFSYISHSRSLLADAFESMANFIITIVVLVSLNIAETKLNDRHPYGYGKIEFLAAGAVNLILLIAALGFTFASFKEMMFQGEKELPGFIAIWAAIISIIGNQFAYRYSKCTGEKLRSPILLANAAVSQVDVATSVAVIVAVIGTNMGIDFLDHLVAIVIAILVIKTAFDGFKKSVRGLMDFAPPEDSGRVRRLSGTVKGIKDVGEIRVRHVGRKTWIDIEIYVARANTVKSSRVIGNNLKKLLFKKIKNLEEVLVQVTPVKSTGGN